MLSLVQYDGFYLLSPVLSDYLPHERSRIHSFEEIQFVPYHRLPA